MKMSMLLPVFFAFLLFSSCGENPKPVADEASDLLNNEEKEAFVIFSILNKVLSKLQIK